VASICWLFLHGLLASTAMGRKRKAAVLEDDSELARGPRAGASSAPTSNALAKWPLRLRPRLFLKSEPHALGLRVLRTFKSV
jgi:hypothetical protein